MSEPAPIELFRMLAIRRDLALGGLAGSRVRAVLAAAAVRFDPAATFTEAGVNTVLRGFLAGAGSMLATDHVELRRWLVDCRLLIRDGFGRSYARAEPPPAEFAPFLRAFEATDLDALTADARAAEATVRAARRARWAAQHGGAG